MKQCSQKYTNYLTILSYLHTHRYRRVQLGLCQLFCPWCTGKYEGRHYVGDLVKNKTCNCFPAQSASFNLTMKDIVLSAAVLYPPMSRRGGK